MVYCIGLTGNIASGKSTVAKLFTQLGVEVINADHISKDLTSKNQRATHQIIQHFGHDVELHPGELNRKKLRTRIFSNPTEKKWLEDLLHPLIRKIIEQNIAVSKAPYCLIEIPILIDKTFYPYLNKIVVVTSPIKLQIERVMTRDHCSEEEALAVLSGQASLEKYLEGADEVIYNDSDLEALRHRVEHLHTAFLQEAIVLMQLSNHPE